MLNANARTLHPFNPQLQALNPVSGSLFEVQRVAFPSPIAADTCRVGRAVAVVEF